MASKKTVRPPAVAGLFYSDDPRELKRSVEGMLASARRKRGSSQDQPPPKALVAPHAGYRFSGPVAADGFSLFDAAGERPVTALVLGPAHRHYVPGFALPDAAAMGTPLGEIPVDATLAEEILRRYDCETSGAAHAAEHSLEVELPFLQSIYGQRLRIVPVLVGDAPARSVAQLIADYWSRDDVVFVLSSDLSHYLPYEDAQRRDRSTIDHLLRADAADLSGHDACGYRVLNGLIEFMAERQPRRELLSKANSADRAGPRDRVVGYASIGIWG